MLAPRLTPTAADLAWLRSLAGGEEWPVLTPLAATRLRGLMAALGLDALLNLLDAATVQGRRQPVIEAYKAWIAANPASPQLFAAWFNLGAAFGAVGDGGNAVQCYRHALALKPDLYQASINLGLALEGQGDANAALATWEQALQPDAARIALFNHHGRLLENRRRFGEAEQSLRASLLLDPAQPDVLQHWGHLRQKGCIWPLYPANLPGISAETATLNAGPLGALALTDDVALQRRIVERWITRKVPAAPRRLSPDEGYRHDRIRVGYLSSDFCRHAVSFLIVEALERHDRTQFEVFGYCSSPEDGSDIQRRFSSPILASSARYRYLSSTTSCATITSFPLSRRLPTRRVRCLWPDFIRRTTVASRTCRTSRALPKDCRKTRLFCVAFRITTRSPR